jgi:hypothetical protein
MRPGDDRVATTTAVLLTSVALVVRLIQARESLWLDELHTAWVAQGPLASVVSRAAEGNQSPLYFWGEWLNARAFGASELTFRMPSILAGTALLVIAYVVVRRCIGVAWLGVLAVLLLAVDGQATYFATEARPYALVQCVALLHMALFAVLTSQPTVGRRAVFVLGAALMFHLHYTSALFVAGELAWYVWRLTVAPPAYRPRMLGADLAVLALLAAPAAPLLAAVFARRRNWEAFVDQANLLTGVAMVPWAATAMMAAVVVAVAEQLRGSAERPATSGRARRSVAVVLMWAAVVAVPVVLAWLLTASDVARLLWPRYLAASAPAAVLLLTGSIAAVRSERARVSLGVLFAAVAMGTSPVTTGLMRGGTALAWRRDDWRGAIEYFNAQPGHDRGAVFVRSRLIESDALAGERSDQPLREYTLYPVTSLYRIDADAARLVPLARGDPLAALRAADGSAALEGTAWLVFNGAEEDAMETERRLCNWLAGASHGVWTAVARHSFGTVHVARLDQSSASRRPAQE